MSLSRQLVILISLLLLLLLLGTLLISVHNTRAYLESQLASHAQDAATSLGLSASARVEEQDRATVTAMVNAMFHRGDYRQIRFEDLSGEPWIERSAEVDGGEVPAWFIRTFTLDPPERSAIMMSGWRQVGRVVVSSDPGLAYSQLWQTTRQTLYLFLLGALLVLLGGLFGLRIVLRPLKAVERQAEAICNREFPVVEGRPFTIEFRRVVEAMNRLSAKVQRMLAEAEARATQLRQQAFQDPLTGLANRRQFMDVLEHRAADPELFGGGGLLLLQLNGLKELNQASGFAAGDRLLAEVGRCLADELQEQPRATLAHLAGADFAVLVEGVELPQLQDLAMRLSAALAALYRPLALPSADVVHIGAVLLSGQSASQLLAEADMALREAQRAGANAWVLGDGGMQATAVRSASAWRELIESAIRERRYHLLRQPVLGCADRGLLHHELFLRLADPADPQRDITAAIFMPMAESAGLAARIDRAVLEDTLAAIEVGAFPARVAVNLSAASLSDSALLDWLEAQARRRSAAACRLILEWPEYGVSKRLDLLHDWIERLSPLGLRFSLDHFGTGFASFAYLRKIKPHCLKIDGSFVRHLDQHEDNQFYLRAISEIAHGLDMQVIAESVESEAVWALLRTLGIDAAQGYWVGVPAASDPVE